MMYSEKISSSVNDTEKIGAELADRLLRENKPYSFIAMYGDLGSGKTAFIRGLSSVIAPNAHVCSPTYNIVNEYQGDRCKLCHFDMYRITSEDDLYSIGFYDYDRCMIAAEWCENVPFALPESYIKVTIAKTGENSRKITISEVQDK